MFLGEVRHQEHAQNAIRRALLRERLPHAYIFHGPDGVGKEAFANALGQLLLCEKIEVNVPHSEFSIQHSAFPDACGRCEDCRGVLAGTHPDLHLIHRYLIREHPDAIVRKRKGLDISVDVLRHFLIERAGLTPIRGRAKVFIIREADCITVQAQNALLKTLEEPPGPTFIILLVSSLDRLLPTTLSRCQLVRFDALPTDFILTKLTELVPGLPSAQLDWYARAGHGSLGWAVQAAQAKLYEVNQVTGAGLARLYGVNAGAATRAGSAKPPRGTTSIPQMADPQSLVTEWMEQASTLGDHYRKQDPDISDTEATRRGLCAVLLLAANWYADVIRQSSGDPAAILNRHDAAEIVAAAGILDAESAAQAIGQIANAERQLDLNVHTQLCIECLLNDLADASTQAA